MGALVTWGMDEQSVRKTVYYEGTSTIQRGMPVCYNYDTTTNWTGVQNADGTFTETTTTAEGYQNEGKFIRVENPSAANSVFFAGVVADSPKLGAAGPAAVEIYVPNGAIVPVYTDKSVTIKDPLYLEPGQTTFTDIAIGRQVGIAMETVDRSGTAGLVLALIDTNVPQTDTGMVLRSRTAVQLPTSAIWSNFDLATLKNTPGASVLDTDFVTTEGRPHDAFADTTATHTYLPGTNGIGEYRILTSADNEEGSAQWNIPITVSGGAKWAWEARLKVTNVTDARGTMFAGLMFRTANQAGDVVADDGAALTDGDALGFCRFAADGDIIDFIYDEGGQATNVHDADYHTVVADTYVVLGMYFNGTTIQGYINGVADGTAISAADIAAADFPTAAVVVPTVAIKGDHADDIAVTLDWIRVAQMDA